MSGCATGMLDWVIDLEQCTACLVWMYPGSLSEGVCSECHEVREED